MPKALYRKLDIAHEYLSLAADLYFAERCFPSLALAAMAEEIFEAVMRARNEGHKGAPTSRLRVIHDLYRPISWDLIAIAQAINPKLRALKGDAVRQMLNRTKDRSKHGTLRSGKGFDLLIELDPELEAWTMLGRAIENYIRLHYEPEGAVIKFFRLYQAGRKTWHDRGGSDGPHAKPYTLPTQKAWK